MKPNKNTGEYPYKNNEALDISPYMKDPVTSDANLPELPGELIQGVMRKGGKLMLAGASKSGKTCLLLSLAICLSTGAEWCGMRCAKGRVLFVNLEVREEMFMHRQYETCKAMNVDFRIVSENLKLCTLRGKFSEIKELVDSLFAAVHANEYNVIIIDPAYKVQDGIENNADSITRFCGELDRLAEGLGCSVIYSHHHSKGYQAWKDAEDRASGSGVFARDADAIIDMIELKPDDDSSEGVPFRMEFVLRGFREHRPVNVWFDYPCHRLDTTGALAKRSARKPGNISNATEADKREELADFEDTLDTFMGERDVVSRKEFERHSNMKPKRLKALLDESTHFENVSHANHAEIRRRTALTSNTQPAHREQGKQGAASL